ncbi:MAG: flavin reductase family protein, partial [Vulcanimicrobiaceae bacterium]
MRHFPTGVSIVTTSADGVPKGFTATAIASVSAEPPMVLVCVNRQGRSHPFISQAGVFCVNLLGVEQRELAARFAARRDEDPFAAITHHFERTGAPVIDGALAFLDCTVAEEHSAGTHTIFIGAVQRAGMRAGEPLGYFDGAYRDFGCRIA